MMLTLFGSNDGMKSHPVAKTVAALAITAFVFNIGLSLSGFYNWTFDSWAHMFFSSHYMNAWFDTWDLRWFGGFSVTSYPPLMTQLLALGGFIFGLENAYILLSLIGMILVPIAVYYFCSNFFSHRDSTWAAFLSILLPSIYITNYTWGQFPSLFALITALFTGYFLWRYLTQGKLKHAILAALLVGITATIHHLTFICFIPLIVLTTALMYMIQSQPEIKQTFKRLIVFGTISLPLVIIPMYPFWKFALEAGIQAEIPHITRTNLFSDGMVFLEFVVAPYFLLLLVIPFTPLVAFKNRKLIPLLITAIFLFLLGLGGSTQMPQLIFGSWWKWLTYERFVLWASVLFLPFVVMLLASVIIKFSKSRFRWVLSTFFIFALIAMGLSSAYLGTEPVRRTFLPSPPAVDVEPLVAFLDSPNVGQQYRYITLGFGEPQMEKLTALSTAQSLDGTYYFARTLPVLRESGIASLDASRYFDTQLKTLDIILADADNYNLKTVLVNDIFYYQILENNGFSLKWSAESMLDNRLAGVTIWEKEDVPPIIGEPDHEVGFSSYLWGIAPLTLLLALFTLLLIDANNSRRKIDCQIRNVSET